MSDLKILLRFYIDSGINTFFEKKGCDSIVYDSQDKRSIDDYLKDDEIETYITDSLDNICQDIRNFNQCDLIKTAINTVIYDGNPRARIMLIGEAPGASEDEKGIPFCGQSGKLLDNILKSINLSRIDDVFITNTVFWRPPGNRRPTAVEISLCKPLLERIIAFINPKIIILVGSTAVESVLNIKAIPMSELRQNKYIYLNNRINNQIQTVTIFHPSYLLRQPSQKKAMWFDMLKIKKIIHNI